MVVVVVGGAVLEGCLVVKSYLSRSLFGIGRRNFGADRGRSYTGVGPLLLPLGEGRAAAVGFIWSLLCCVS